MKYPTARLVFPALPRKANFKSRPFRNSLAITQADLELIQHAKGMIGSRYKPHNHHVGAALRTKSGLVITGIHVEANVGRVSICAEAVALGKALTEGICEIETIVAVRRDDNDPGVCHDVSPCGMCREMINDYLPGGFCLFVEDGTLTVL